MRLFGNAESRHVSSLETGLSRSHITDSLLNGRSSPYLQARHSPSPAPSPVPSPLPHSGLYRSPSPRLSPRDSPSLLTPVNAFHVNGVTEKRTESSRGTYYF